MFIISRIFLIFFFFKQKTAYEMRISDWSSDVCSSDLDPTYRSGATMQLLWRGIAEYVFYHDISIMFGCASLPGTDPEQLRMPLAYLRHHHLAPRALRARAVPERYEIGTAHVCTPVTNAHPV